MNITTRANDFPLTGAIDRFVKDELRSAFRRLDAEIISIDVSMKDANGPKGGVDKQALVRVQMRNRQVITVEAEHENLYAAVRGAVKRAKYQDESTNVSIVSVSRLAGLPQLGHGTSRQLGWRSSGLPGVSNDTS